MIFSSCEDNSYKFKYDESAKKEPVQVTVSNTAEEAYVDENDYSNCVFDTNSCQFTTEAILKFDPQLDVSYSNKLKQATAVLSNGDTLWLHIGGCSHFKYLAKLSSSIPFTDTLALTEKAKWLAQTFFEGSGFDLKYSECIDNGWYEKGVSTKKKSTYKRYQINNPDTSQTNLIYDGFSFEKKGNQVIIEIGGTVN